MSDDIEQDTAPVTADNPAAAPVDQTPAAVALDPATAAAIAQAVVAGLQAARPPAPAPVTPVDVPPATPAQSTAPAAAAAPSSAPVDDEAPYSEVFAPGKLAVHTYDHFGKTKHQVLLVLGTYQVPVIDPRTGQATGLQDRVRLLPIGQADETADLPADAPELLPADGFDWEDLSR